MIINEKIHIIRLHKNMSLAELAYKTDCSIAEIKEIETNGTSINGYTLLQIIKAFDISIEEFQNMKVIFTESDHSI